MTTSRSDGPPVRAGELAAALPVGSDKVGVAEGADRRGAILLAACPQVAAGEAAEHRSLARLSALSLQGEEDFLDRIGHGST
jgi:hypothetical protein